MNQRSTNLLRLLACSVVTVFAGSVPAVASPITYPPIPTVYQEAYIKASNTGLGDNFGKTMAYANGLLVVGAPKEESLIAGAPSDNSGGSVGAAYVYSRTATGWQFEAYLKADTPQAGSLFGAAVATDGNLVVVGAPRSGGDDAGRAFVYRNYGGGTGWQLERTLAPSDGESLDNFGSSVAVSGAVVAVGAPQHDGDNNTSGDAGLVYLYTGPWWGPEVSFRDPTTQAGDRFGTALAMDGEFLVVGARGEDAGTGPLDPPVNLSGAAYVVQVGNGPPATIAYLKASNPSFNDQFGKVVAISGTTVVVGTDLESSASVGVDSDGSDNSLRQAGAAYVFALSSGVWQQEAYLKPNQTGFFEHFGASVAVSGDTVVVGATGEDGSIPGVNGTQTDFTHGSGAAYVFRRTGSAWSQTHYLKASNPDGHDSFGRSVAISGSTILAGASDEDSSAVLIDGWQGNDFANAAHSGAVYAFTGFIK